ncbi:MAG: hypothetical protein H7308_02855, partial [Chthonomonadaceae bacterium]|nr:hypothetical protein [Chthonomonadaceae bacterium]
MIYYKERGTEGDPFLKSWTLQKVRSGHFPNLPSGGNQIADGRKPIRFSLKAYEVTLEFILEHYEGIDEAYAHTRDLSKPLIAVPQEERLLIIDGWHRLLRAVLEEVEELPLYLLTQEEADAAPRV